MLHLMTRFVYCPAWIPFQFQVISVHWMRKKEVREPAFACSFRADTELCLHTTSSEASVDLRRSPDQHTSSNHDRIRDREGSTPASGIAVWDSCFFVPNASCSGATSNFEVAPWCSYQNSYRCCPVVAPDPDPHIQSYSGFRGLNSLQRHRRCTSVSFFFASSLL